MPLTRNAYIPPGALSFFREEERVCRDCPAQFTAHAPNQVRCPECQKLQAKKTIAAANLRMKARRAKAKSVASVLPAAGDRSTVGTMARESR
jgi:hypothetical protein